MERRKQETELRSTTSVTSTWLLRQRYMHIRGISDVITCHETCHSLHHGYGKKKLQIRLISFIDLTFSNFSDCYFKPLL